MEAGTGVMGKRMGFGYTLNGELAGLAEGSDAGVGEKKKSRRSLQAFSLRSR